MTNESSGKDLQELAQQMVDGASSSTAIAVAPPAGSFPPYTPAAMVDLMVRRPGYTHAQLAEHFGRLPSWTSAVLASDAFQEALDGRRLEVADPSLSATLEERFRGLAIRATTVLEEKLNSKGVSDLVVLKAAEIGIKALGMGTVAQPVSTAPQLQNSSQSIAEKLLAAMDNRDAERDRARTVDVETVEVKNG